jgi:hypothetical protein
MFSDLAPPEARTGAEISPSRGAVSHSRNLRSGFDVPPANYRQGTQCLLEAEDGAPLWLRAIRWTAALTGIAGGILLAVRIPWSGWGFAFFAVSSAAWVAAGLLMRVRSLVMVNTVLLLTNLFGIYRWLIATD